MRRFWVVAVSLTAGVLGYMLGAKSRRRIFSRIGLNTTTVDKAQGVSSTVPKGLRLRKKTGDRVEWKIVCGGDDLGPGEFIRIVFKDRAAKSKDGPSPLHPASPIGQTSLRAVVDQEAASGRYPYDVVLVRSDGSHLVLESQELVLVDLF